MQYKTTIKNITINPSISTQLEKVVLKIDIMLKMNFNPKQLFF